jgi:2-amino-4-hydroxy-6-hydroxymethyldihydropteridine diphosphokinase
MPQLLVGIGSNLGDRADSIDQATSRLAKSPGLALIRRSRAISSRPVGGPPIQPDFLNAAVLAESNLEPTDLLHTLLEIERAMGRQRTEPWGPRIVDLDLLCYGDLVMSNSRLTLPHPWMCVRSFVLKPCEEIAPDFEHPTLRLTMRQLWQRLRNPEGIVAIVPAQEQDRDLIVSIVHRVSQESCWAAIDADSSELTQLIELTSQRPTCGSTLPTNGQWPHELRALVVFDRHRPAIGLDQVWRLLPEPYRHERAPAVSLSITDAADAEAMLRFALAAITAAR